MATADLPPVSHLPVETKRKLLARPTQNLLASAQGQLPVFDAGGGVMIYRVPADARERAEEAMQEAGPERHAELDRRIANLDQTFGSEEALNR